MVLIFLLIVTGLVILWVGIPILAERAFGIPAPFLTQFQMRKYGGRILLSLGELTIPAKTNLGSGSFEISEGSTISQIAMNLESAGYIKDAASFRDYLIYKGYDSTIRAGQYSFSSSISAVEIAELIRSDNPIVPFYLYPGWRAEEVAKALEISGIQTSQDEFMRIANNPGEYGITVGSNSPISLEGYLYPGEYEIPRDATVVGVVNTFILRFAGEAMPAINSRKEDLGLTVDEIVTLASIIQRETLIESEMPRMASVFFNRLNQGMRLETDPTVQYSIGYDPVSGSWWKTPLSYTDLAIQSNFNTYHIYGLPPHAISNPSMAAINAVLFPESTNYYYFQAKCDDSGEHVFAETYEEHLSNNCR
jgi:UPF0755 protein